MGGNARNLRFLWGFVGERQTEELLRLLDDSWECVHDIVRGRGKWKSNWDHVLIGPAGVFLLDSKSYSSTSKAKDDALRSGRLICRGSDIRGAAISLKEALEPKVGKQYVNAAINDSIRAGLVVYASALARISPGMLAKNSPPIGFRISR